MQIYLVGVDVRQHFFVVAGVVGLRVFLAHVARVDVQAHVAGEAEIGGEYFHEKQSCNNDRRT